MWIHLVMSKCTLSQGQAQISLCLQGPGAPVTLVPGFLFHFSPFSAPHVSSLTSYLVCPDCYIGVEFYITTQGLQKLLLSINFTCFCVLINAYLQYRFGLGLDYPKYLLITMLCEIGLMRFCPCGSSTLSVMSGLFTWGAALSVCYHCYLHNILSLKTSKFVSCLEEALARGP